MRHLTEEELTDSYYGDVTCEGEEHLRSCSECQATLARLADILRPLDQYLVPEPASDFEARLWTKLADQLPQKTGWRWPVLRPMVMGPALASLLLLPLGIGLLMQRGSQPAGISAQAQTRVLSSTLTDHLDRSQILLAEVANANLDPDALKSVQDRARDLVDENRLLRLANGRVGANSSGAVLEDLELILVSLANAAADSSPDDLSALQKRIDDEGLRFKMRIINDDLRREERKL
jgi:hypothetical protein